MPISTASSEMLLQDPLGGLMGKNVLPDSLAPRNVNKHSWFSITLEIITLEISGEH